MFIIQSSHCIRLIKMVTQTYRKGYQNMNRYYILCKETDPASDLIKKGAKVISLSE